MIGAADRSVHRQAGTIVVASRGLEPSRPLRIDGGKPIGRVSIAISEGVGKAKPSAVVTWLERLDDQSAAVQVRELREKNGLSRAVTVGRVSSGRLSGFPRIAITGDTLFLAWTEDRIKTVKMAVAEVSVQ